VSGDWLLALGCIFGVNPLPAFGPPTWAVLVFFRLNWDLAAVPLILLGALAAASGRLLLAATTRRFRGRFSRSGGRTSRRPRKLSSTAVGRLPRGSVCQEVLAVRAYVLHVTATLDLALDAVEFGGHWLQRLLQPRCLACEHAGHGQYDVALSPVPSAQLFVAAGLLRVP
jgi:hypothetical protein